MRSYRFHPLAVAELYESAAYYQEISPDLGDDFRVKIEQSVTKIRLNPLIHPLHGRKGFRKCFVKRFPYAIYFRVIDDLIFISAISHQSRRRNYWIHRKWAGESPR